jgi:hypothetical protein
MAGNTRQVTAIFPLRNIFVPAIDMGDDIFIHDTYLHLSPWGWVLAAVAISAITCLVAMWLLKRKSR